jgi:hypothetical protein
MNQQPTTYFTYVLETCSPRKFVEYWCAQYDYPDIDEYEGILVSPLTKNRLRRLFAWKNGMTLSGKKAQALEEKIVSKLPVIRKLAENFDQVLFDKHFGKISVV